MLRPRRLLAAASTSVIVLALAACGGGGDASRPAADAGSGKVEVVDFEFKPSNTTVKAGTTVVWTFKGNTSHTVASKEGESEIPASPEMKTGEHSHQFTKAGSFAYVCTIHGTMAGTIVVTA